MPKHTQFLLAILSLVLLVGCKQNIISAIESETAITLQLYDKGRPVVTQTLSKESDEYHAIIEWASNNTEGWSPSVATYVPYILVSGNHFQLNITPRHAIFGHDGQYKKSIPSDIYTQLKEKLINSVLQKGPAALKLRYDLSGPTGAND